MSNTSPTVAVGPVTGGVVGSDTNLGQASADGSVTVRLAHVPITFFAAVLGLAGTAVAWQLAADLVTLPPVGAVLAWAALAAYAVLAAAYLTKSVRHPAAVRAEWRHPVKLAFAPLASVSLLLLALTVVSETPTLSAVLWWTGAAAQLALTVGIVGAWTGGRFRLEHVHPGWFIPAVGNLVAPLAGVAHAPRELSWLFFAVGLVYWLALLPMVLLRLATGGPLPARLMPTLAILVAPPAVGYLSYLRLGGQADDPFARVLLGVAVFQALLVVSRLPVLLRMPYAVSWWAYTFPLAALSSALLVTARVSGGAGYRWGGLAVLAGLSVLVAGLAARTGTAMARHEICRPD